MHLNHPLKILFLILPPAFLLCAALAGPSTLLQEAEKPEIGKETCLTCHGPFDILSEKTVDYKAPSGEIVSPHRYVPHDSREDAAIPECLQCHQSHPIPPSESDVTEAKAREKPDLEFCYKCHHIREFISCSVCHKGQ